MSPLPTTTSSAPGHSFEHWTLDSPGCHDLYACRSFFQIIYSCVLTLFACIWVSMHPNAPGLEDSAFSTFLRRFRLAMLSLIAPEVVVQWSIRQWIVAGNIAKKAPKLTTTHGFFVSMGGFMISSGPGRGYRPLLPSMIGHGKEVDPEVISRTDARDIQDKSKGDALSKGLVFIQLSWFVSQCVARYLNKLHITELELVTLGFAILNVSTYFVWWNKPLRVDRPILIPFTLRLPPSDRRKKKSSNPFYRFNDWIGHGAKTVLGTATFDDESKPRVPSLWAGEVEGRVGIPGASAAAALLGIVFGATHCLAWWFAFPTWQEQMLWRISSAIIVLVPVFYVLLYGFLLVKLLPSGQGWFQVLSRSSQLIAAIGYIAARILLLGLTITTLRSLPDDAFSTVPWTKYIPHI